MAFDGSTILAATRADFSGAVFTDTFSIGGSDVDMVAIMLEAGNTYAIDVDNGSAGDFGLRIFDAFGQEVRANDDGFRTGDDVLFSLSPYGEFIPNYSGTYYVAVSPYYLMGYDPFTTTGRVTPENSLIVTAGTLTVTRVGLSLWPSATGIGSIIPEDSSDETDVLREEDGTLRVAYLGAVDNPVDIDMARIDLNKGDVLVVDVNGLEGNGTVLRIFDDGSLQIGFDDDSGFGEDPELVFVAPVLDDYYIGISGEGNAAYSGLDGSGAVAGTLGDFEVIIHRNPTQIGSSLSNLFNGSENADYIVSLAGNDTLNGGLGQDTLAGGDDNDTITGGDGRDVLYGEAGADTIDGGRGADVVSGGIGNDRVQGGTTGATDLLEGGAGDDTLLDGNGADTLRGDSGNDSLNAGAQDNVVDAGTGNDTLIAGPGADTLLGGAGNDSLNAADGANFLDGGSGADSIRGGGQADTLLGSSGADDLTALAGADLILGGADADTLRGGTGDDTLFGQTGNDLLSGGTGADVFVFTAVVEQTDTIDDFALGSDRIDLATLFGPGVVNSGNLAQFVQVSVAGISDTFLGVDANGLTDGLSFSIIAQVNGLTPAQLFSADNFIL